MDYELELSPANRLRIARAFASTPRVDFAIQCVVEGQMGRAFVDDPADPSAYCIQSGIFWYIAGQVGGPWAGQLLRSIPAYDLLMRLPDAWLALAREIYGKHLRSMPRYRLSAAELDAGHLTGLLAGSPFAERVVPLDVDSVARIVDRPEHYLDLSTFDSIDDFVERGFGFAVLDADDVMGVAHSSLVCSQGIEVSVYVEEAHRRKGVATALSCRLVLESLRWKLTPSWDAANPESLKLARKLGYRFVDSYDAHFHTEP
jgi:GNAT superfamily N-acetyltransferase